VCRAPGRLQPCRARFTIFDRQRAVLRQLDEAEHDHHIRAGIPDEPVDRDRLEQLANLSIERELRLAPDVLTHRVEMMLSHVFEPRVAGPIQHGDPGPHHPNLPSQAFPGEPGALRPHRSSLSVGVLDVIGELREPAGVQRLAVADLRDLPDEGIPGAPIEHEPRIAGESIGEAGRGPSRQPL